MTFDIFKKKEESKDNWYALFVETGQEDNVKERVKYRLNDRLKVLVPKRKLKERRNGVWFEKTRVLFPGYILLNGYITKEGVKDFVNIPGVYKLLKSGYDPLKIEPEEISVLNRLIDNGETIGFSDILENNGKVKVLDGPLTGMDGMIISIDKRKGRAKVLLNFLGEERSIEFGVNILQQA